MVQTKRKKVLRVFPYFGGKGQFLKYILPLIPKHDVYVEPFWGGGSVFLNKTPARENVLNDLDKWIYNAWLVIKNWGQMKDSVLGQPWYLLERSKDHIPRDWKIRFRCVRNEAEAYEIKSFPDARAFYMFYARAKFGFGSQFFTVGGRPGISVDLNKFFGDYDFISDFLNKNNVVIRNDDFRDVLRDYRDDKNAFFFLDPPYIQALRQKYYGIAGNKQFNNVYPEDLAEALAGVVASGW